MGLLYEYYIYIYIYPYRFWTLPNSFRVWTYRFRKVRCCTPSRSIRKALEPVNIRSMRLVFVVVQKQAWSVGSLVQVSRRWRERAWSATIGWSSALVFSFSRPSHFSTIISAWELSRFEHFETSPARNQTQLAASSEDGCKVYCNCNSSKCWTS